MLSFIFMVLQIKEKTITKKKKTKIKQYWEKQTNKQNRKQNKICKHIIKRDSKQMMEHFVLRTILNT